MASVGSLYQFSATAADADGDSLTFSIQNRPSWSTFDATSGRLSGTPQTGDVGSYNNIVVSVSDGQATTSLDSFSIDVVVQGTGTVTLQWTAPVDNEDGSPLDDLAGYNIYYGVEPGVYTEEIPINNPSVTTYIVEGLMPDTYYFVATARNDDGIESQFSNESVKTVN